jgi:hypothetical protein
VGCYYLRFEEPGEVIWIIELWFGTVMVYTTVEEGKDFSKRRDLGTSLQG